MFILLNLFLPWNSTSLIWMTLSTALSLLRFYEFKSPWLTASHILQGWPLSHFPSASKWRRWLIQLSLQLTCPNHYAYRDLSNVSGAILKCLYRENPYFKCQRASHHKFILTLVVSFKFYFILHSLYSAFTIAQQEKSFLYLYTDIALAVVPCLQPAPSFTVLRMWQKVSTISSVFSPVWWNHKKALQ